MRVRMLIAVTWVFATLLLGVACTKTSYKSYTCTCLEVENGSVSATTDYGIESESRLEAGTDCADIENRVNNHNRDIGSSVTVGCKLK